MLSFLVGLLVIVLAVAISTLGILLLPLMLVLGLFARLILGVLLGLFVIWLIGKVTLLTIEYLRSRSKP